MEESCNKYLNFDKTVGIKIVLSSDISYPDWVYELIKNISIAKSDAIDKIKLINTSVDNIIKFCESNLTFEFQYIDENNNQLLCIKMTEINFGGETYRVFLFNNDNEIIDEYVLDFTSGCHVRKIECIQCNGKANCLCENIKFSL